MKIALIGPGIMAIPPPGWGAVEILIWDYCVELSIQGHDVDIINKMRTNTRDHSDPNSEYYHELVHTINSKEYDFVHIHYDCFYHIMPRLKCNKIAITSHYPYIDQPEKHGQDGFTPVFRGICDNKNHFIFALSKKDQNMFLNHAYDKNKIVLTLNGANNNELRVDYNGKNRDRSIYIGKIEPRKCQYKYYTIPNIDFYGKCQDPGFSSLPCFKGEKEHSEMMNIMSEYGNLVLLSSGENGTPLVIKEALMCGLPIVTNKYSADDLDPGLPFIDIIPDDKLDDLDYIDGIIKENLKKQNRKKEIRKYAEDTFSWELLISRYVTNTSNL